MRRALAILAVASLAHAGPDLRAHELPPPHTLHMRDDKAEKVTVTQKGENERAPWSDRLIVRVDAGLAVDGARLADNAKESDGTPLPALPAGSYDSVRTFGLGQIFLGTRDVGAKGLSTYSATDYVLADENDGAPVAALDRGTVLRNRAFWIEADGVFRQKYLQPVRLRAGRMYVYSPTIVHVDGALLSWDNRWLAVSTFTGTRVPDYDSLGVGGPGRGAVAGSEVRADLHRFHIPLFIDAATMRYGGHTHSDLAAYVEPRRDIILRSSTRLEDGRLARQRLEIRARISEDSTIMVDSQLRTQADWFWDYASIAADLNTDKTVKDSDIDTTAARYLDLGPVRPRFQTSVQAGTVIQQNVDLLAHGAVAVDVDKSVPNNTHEPEYVEGGAGVEVRLRRAFAVQSTFLVRDYKRPDPGSLVDVAGTTGLLPNPERTGEESLAEGGFAVRYSLGARRFSAEGELYGRRTRYAPVYLDPNGDRPEVIELDGGARVTVDAWVSRDVQLRGEYDVTSTLDEVPELRGLKALRLWIEGTY